MTAHVIWKFVYKNFQLYHSRLLNTDKFNRGQFHICPTEVRCFTLFWILLNSLFKNRKLKCQLFLLPSSHVSKSIVGLLHSLKLHCYSNDVLPTHHPYNKHNSMRWLTEAVECCSSGLQEKTTASYTLVLITWKLCANN